MAWFLQRGQCRLRGAEAHFQTFCDLWAAPASLSWVCKGEGRAPCQLKLVSGSGSWLWLGKGLTFTSALCHFPKNKPWEPDFCCACSFRSPEPFAVSVYAVTRVTKGWGLFGLSILTHPICSLYIPGRCPRCAPDVCTCAF